MAETPDEVYERVKAEEQAKGSSPPVAEGRAKSARFKARRAQEGGGSDGQAAAPPQEAEQPSAAQPAAAEAKAGDGQQPAAAGQQAPAAEAKQDAQPAAASEEDPEEVYNRVLAEEQSKGSSPPVAEARAKAARHRARKGAESPAPIPPTTSAPAQAPPAKEKEPAPAAASAAQPAAAEAPTGRQAAATAAISPGAPSPERMQRLLAVVKPEAIQRVEKEPMDRVNAWPHLMASEFLALLAVTAFLVVFSTFIDAPFRELANINTTPNPSKAPWYFLGLQELLRYFHPQIAGVTIPQWLILGWIAAPYIDRNPSSKPEDRKLAISIWTMFVLMFAILTILGSLFRGPGFNFIYPWDQGLFFEL
jgi:menaquinol-cytochrome c reductase cytochrome b/c subunit